MTMGGARSTRRTVPCGWRCAPARAGLLALALVAHWGSSVAAQSPGLLHSPAEILAGGEEAALEELVSPFGNPRFNGDVPPPSVNLSPQGFNVSPDGARYMDVQVEDPWIQRRPFPRLLPPSDGRSRGRGNPLTRESWLNRPFSIGAYNGGFIGADPIPGEVTGSAGYYIGLRAGWDAGHFFGFESQIGSTTFGVANAVTGEQLGNNNVFTWTNNMNWYPWGDAQWRPYGTVGLGMADFHFNNASNIQISETMFSTPIGGGVKYRYSTRLALRLEVVDNIAYGVSGQLDTTHNIMVTGGVEARFGAGGSRNYWPWNPSRAIR